MIGHMALANAMTGIQTLRRIANARLQVAGISLRLRRRDRAQRDDLRKQSSNHPGRRAIGQLHYDP